VRCGEGKPLVLIHGITTSSFIWDDLLPILNVHHDVIALDLGMLRLVIRRAVHRGERITPAIFERIRNEIAVPKSRRAFPG
jgi:pimeloyl-ACP methyl ester carboxylesterase